ncbi:MAG: hypothetical protein ACLFPS_05080 [Clostridia bacterium]
MEKQKDNIDFKAIVTMRKGSIQQQWGHIEDEYFVEDNVDGLVERIQDKYGGSKEEILDKIKEMADKEE